MTRSISSAINGINQSNSDLAVRLVESLTHFLDWINGTAMSVVIQLCKNWMGDQFVSLAIGNGSFRNLSICYFGFCFSLLVSPSYPALMYGRFLVLFLAVDIDPNLQCYLWISKLVLNLQSSNKVCSWDGSW